MNVYSFKDVTGAFAHPLAGTFTFYGQIGMGQFVVSMDTEKTSHQIAADGTVMVSAIAGDNGRVTIEVQQTSLLHSFLLTWYNLVVTAFNNSDTSNFASAALTIRSVTDNSSHILTGVSPSKIPDKTYAAQGQTVTWTLMAAEVKSIAA
jgi:Protein of unknown function (DUF3277)